MRPGFSHMMDEKVARVNALLDDESSKGAQDADNPNDEGSKTNGSNPNGNDNPSNKFAANENKECAHEHERCARYSSYLSLDRRTRRGRP